MRTKGTRRSRSLFIHFLIYICLAFVLTVISLSIALSVTYERKSLELIRGHSRRILAQVSYSADYLDESARIMATSLISNNSVIQLMHNSSLSIWEITKTVEAVNAQVGSASFVHSVYIYNRETDSFYTTLGRGILGREEFFDREIAEMVSAGTRVEKLHPLPRRVSARADPEYTGLTNIYTYVLYERWRPDGSFPAALFVNVLADYLMDTIRSLHSAENESRIYIVDEEGRIVGHPEKDAFLSSIHSTESLDSVLLGDESHGSYVCRPDGAKSLVTFVPSERTGWRFVQVSPYQSTIRPVLTQRLLILLIGGTFLLAGLGLSFVLSRRLTLPIRTLVRRVGRLMDSSKGMSHTNNELLYLANAFSETVDNVNLLKRFKQNNIRILKQELLRSILNGQKTVRAEILEKVAEYELAIRADGFYQVVVFRVDRGAGRGTIKENGSAPVFSFVIGRMLGNLAGIHMACESVEMEPGLFALVLNTSDEAEEEQLPGGITTLVSDAQSSLWSSLGVSVSSAVSGIGEDICELAELYEEASRLLEYRLLFGYRCLITAACLEYLAEKPYRFPIEHETVLMEALRNGDLEAARSSYSSIIETIRSFPYETLRLSLNRLSSSLFDLLGTIEYNSRLSFPVRFSSFMQEIGSCDTLEQINGCFSTVLDTVVTTQKEFSSHKSDQNIQMIKEIIHSRYQDPNLCSGIIAGTMKMSPVYLGRLFRRHCGISLYEYLVEVRLEKSRELLGNTRKTVKDIAREVGIESPRYFFTKFRKRFGFTPTQFRLKEAARTSLAPN